MANITASYEVLQSVVAVQRSLNSKTIKNIRGKFMVIESFIDKKRRSRRRSALL